MIVLLVDDDALVRGMIAESIKDQGWDVMEASTAEEALDLGVDNVKPSILVTDINLGPGMDGVSLAPLARRLWPDIGIVYISGRPLNSACVQPERRERFLPKPFDQQQLSAAISAVMSTTNIGDGMRSMSRPSAG